MSAGHERADLHRPIGSLAVQPTVEPAPRPRPLHDAVRDQQRQRRQQRQHVARLLADRDREQQQRHHDPESQARLEAAGTAAAGGHAAHRAEPEQQERRPGHEAADYDRPVVPPRPGLVEAVGGEPLEVVADEEAGQVVGAVQPPHGQVPGGSDDGEEQRRGGEIGAAEPRRPPFDGDDRRHHQRRDHDGERALGEESQSGGGRCAEQPVPRPRHAVAHGHHGGADGHRDEQGQRQVGQRHPGEGDVPEARGDDARRR